MHIDGNICAIEVLQATAVIEMEMADDDGLDVFDTVSRFGDGLVEVVFFGDIVDLGEDIIDDRLARSISTVV